VPWIWIRGRVWREGAVQAGGEGDRLKLTCFEEEQEVVEAGAAARDRSPAARETEEGQGVNGEGGQRSEESFLWQLGLFFCAQHLGK
jgi:hypothetical protein